MDCVVDLSKHVVGLSGFIDIPTDTYLMLLFPSSVLDLFVASILRHIKSSCQNISQSCRSDLCSAGGQTGSQTIPRLATTPRSLTPNPSLSPALKGADAERRFTFWACSSLRAGEKNLQISQNIADFSLEELHLKITLANCFSKRFRIFLYFLGIPWMHLGMDSSKAQASAAQAFREFL